MFVKGLRCKRCGKELLVKMIGEVWFCVWCEKYLTKRDLYGNGKET